MKKQNLYKYLFLISLFYPLNSAKADDSEELAYYNKIKKEMDDMKKEPVKKGIPLNWNTPETTDK